MEENLVSQLYLHGTSTPIEGTSTPIVYDLVISVPFLDFLGVAIIFFAALFVFKLFLKDLWLD